MSESNSLNDQELTHEQQLIRDEQQFEWKLREAISDARADLLVIVPILVVLTYFVVSLVSHLYRAVIDNFSYNPYLIGGLYVGAGVMLAFIAAKIIQLILLYVESRYKWHEYIQVNRLESSDPSV